jgi:hypothetical protein
MLTIRRRRLGFAIAALFVVAAAGLAYATHPTCPYAIPGKCVAFTCAISG